MRIKQRAIRPQRTRFFFFLFIWILSVSNSIVLGAQEEIRFDSELLKSALKSQSVATPIAQPDRSVAGRIHGIAQGLRNRKRSIGTIYHLK